MRKLLLIAAVCLATSQTLADIINPKPQSYGEAAILTEFGQSFIATANELQVSTVSFMWGKAFNPSNPDPIMTVQLRSGYGFTGTVLGSKTLQAIPDSLPEFTWIDFTFANPIALIAGQTYTLDFNHTNSTSVSGSFVETADNYPDGQLVFPGNPVVVNDLAFRVLNVPEPTPLVLGIIAIAAALASLNNFFPHGREPVPLGCLTRH